MRYINYPDADRIYPVRPYNEKPMHFVYKRDAMRLHDSEYASFKKFYVRQLTGGRDFTTASVITHGAQYCTKLPGSTRPFSTYSVISEKNPHKITLFYE